MAKRREVNFNAPKFNLDELEARMAAAMTRNNIMSRAGLIFSSWASILSK
jgi:hypothetical protein